MAKFKSGDQFTFHKCKANAAIKDGDFSDIQIGQVFTLIGTGMNLYFEDRSGYKRTFSDFNGTYKITKIID